MSSLGRAPAEHERLEREALNEEQFELLCSFIKRYLPNSGSKRRAHGNSLEAVHQAIDMAFINNAGYGVNEYDCLQAFVKLDYLIRIKSASWSQIKVPDIGYFENVYEENVKARIEYPFQTRGNLNMFYFSVLARDVDLIYFSQLRIPFENGNEEKTIKPRENMKRSVKSFFGLDPVLAVEDYMPKKHLI